MTAFLLTLQTETKRNIGNMKKIYITACFVMVALATYAQSGTNSPYSQYGWGVHADQTSGFNRGMNGVGIAFQENTQVNYANPASYAYMDSLMFLFDAGASLQIAKFKENGQQLNAKNANFEYAVAGFRVMRHLGVSFGILPFTNVGYNYATTQNVSPQGNTTYTNTYTGSGGLRQIYVGVGYEPIRGIAVGANFSYVWGGYDRAIVNSYSDAYINTLSKYYTADVNTYKIDLALQLSRQITKNDRIALGLTYTPGHKISADPQCKVISTNSQTGISDTTIYKIGQKLELPQMFGAGIMWNHKNRIKIGVDYTLQKWASVSFPQYQIIGNQPDYVLNDQYFLDRHKVNVGAEFCPNTASRNFFRRIRYRAGASYATPYFKYNNQDGPKEISISAGFGIPIVNTYNNRSVLNISAQYVQSQAKGALKENTIRFNIGLTFNEKWFQKWKFE